MSGLSLFETSHPDKDAKARYDGLVGIDSLKQDLLEELALLLDVNRVRDWQKRHHPRGLRAATLLAVSSPLLVLSGEVGCGKTALATSVATPLAEELDRKLVAMETPSDIRGWGRVGEISARITEAFEQARARAKQTEGGLLIIDEADDLATSRAQMQAHHEDRAGVNVLIKQIDRIAREKVSLAVILITNRSDALDPAVTRRASLHLRFERPNAAQRRVVLERILDGVGLEPGSVDALVAATAPKNGVPFSFSDLTVRLARSAVRMALRANQPFGPRALLEALSSLTPSPLIEPVSATEGAPHG